MSSGATSADRPFARARLAVVALLLLATALAGFSGSQQAVEYTLSFPEPAHRWMQVEIVFPGLPDRPLEVRFARSSPGRYALHEFAKNVYGVTFTDGAGRALDPVRPNLHQWTLAGHDGTVRMSYRVFGDRVDGTYLAVDPTHAHINTPAALAWSPDLADRPASITFRQPPGRRWEVATQLFATGTPLVFTAPNLAYLLDSPIEFGPVTWRRFPAPGASSAGSEAPVIRIALHHTGSAADADRYAADVQRIVAETREVFGEYPPFETGSYTFLADYLPWANGDGMEHRNSTVLTSRNTIAAARQALLGTVAHEFFHAWNVERIRPRSLEPFDFSTANVSPDLWLAEGVTSYYDGLILKRAGLTTLGEFLADLSGTVRTVVTIPAHRFRSAEDMSRLAPFVDAASWVDRTNWTNTFISYYTFGAALGLGFDLAIRERTAGRATLDDFMKAMWRVHGKPGGSRPGVVDRPYTAADVIERLAEVTGDRQFSEQLVRRYVQGREVMDYERLLAAAGLVVRPQNPNRASLGLISLDRGEHGLRIASPTPIGSPAYEAGLDQDDEIVSVGGERVESGDELERVLARRRPGDRVPLVIMRRGEEVSVEATLGEDPRFDIVTVESTGGTPTKEQQAFRKAWLQ